MNPGEEAKGLLHSWSSRRMIRKSHQAVVKNMHLGTGVKALPRSLNTDSKKNHQKRDSK